MASRWDRVQPDRVVAGQHGYTQEASLTFWERRWQTDYLAPMPGVLYQETLQRARLIARAHPQSFLARHLTRLYGVEL